MTSKVSQAADAEADRTLNCKWYLAEDIRVEQGGKLSILGLYPDDMVVVEMPTDEPDPTSEKPIAIEGLAILCLLVGFHGQSKFKLSLGGEDGAPPTLNSELLIEADEAATNVTLISKFRPVLIHSLGRKFVSLSCLEHNTESRFVFTVERRAPGLTPPPARITMLSPTKESAKPARRAKPRSPAKSSRSS